MKINIKVSANSSKSDIARLPDGSYKAFLHSSPVGGEANEELIKLVGEYFDKPKSLIKIVSGLTAKSKVIEIDQ